MPSYALVTTGDSQLRCRERWRSGDFSLASALVCLLACTFSERALAVPAAQPGINWVRLDGAEQCLSVVALVERVEARVRELRFTSTRDADLFVDGSVERASGGGWDVRLEVSARDGKVSGRRDMHFDGETCEVIDDGVALVIAVTLYPEAGLANAGIPLDAATAGSLDALFGGEPSGYGESEVVVEAGSTQCATGACLIYRLNGDPKKPCGKKTSDRSCDSDGPQRAASEEEIARRMYCSCRCDAPEGDPGELCTCESGFSCVPTLFHAPAGVRGSYCVKNGTFSATPL